jgi:uncharacterized protein YeaO (DUF488 family)
MTIKLKRAYEKPETSDGVRILVERLWPRGLSKEIAGVDLWLKDVAPSTELRKWFNHDPEKWEEFKTLYFAELETNPDALTPIAELLKSETLTFIFASKEKMLNSAHALKEYLLKQHV